MEPADGGNHRFAFTVLIPVYNEALLLIPNTLKLLRFLVDNQLDGQIVIGSNGSTDATRAYGELLSGAFPDRVCFFHVERRGAVGEVFRRCAEKVQTPVLISLDMDLSVDVNFIPDALDLLRSHAMVIGSKQSGSQSRSFPRLAGSALFIGCARALLQLPYDDYSLGAKGYRLDRIAPYLTDLQDDTNYVLDIVHRCHHGGLPVAVVPVACRDWRRSRFRLLPEALLRFSHLFGVGYRQLRKQIGRVQD